ncbi:hypothetical protein JAAARDRAFT_79765 [Jaapia argillacea MUCL 33604]|uniref:NAD-dependent epimerase/dehydratase domain-containing protein n=1 Tax=Jaapia argillacea MUCL 33604 TaxID=933084 RepID=A0A067PLY9_9AGAM|nr:hypothetical protein JAAARDRAFT_79765 [Jaapia argillacea MUCL 33604]
MLSNPLILVTGASGFLGSHVVHQLLEAGYRVRGTTRSGKVAATQAAWASYGDRVEIVPLDDVASGDITEALEGVEAVCHVAAPLPGTSEPAVIINGAVEGCLNAVRQAEKAGIKKVVVTSSIVAVLNPKVPWHKLTDQNWNVANIDDALGSKKEDPFYVYQAAKTVAEQELWKFGEMHPHVDITTINPLFLYGSFAPGFDIPTRNPSALSTNGYIAKLLLGPEATFPGLPGYTDVVDTARAHVLALKAPPSTTRKRIILSGYWFKWEDAVNYIAEARPELKDRLVDPKRAPDYGPNTVGWMIDTTRAKEVLGMDKMTDWKESVINAIDGYIAFEKKWKTAEAQ